MCSRSSVGFRAGLNLGRAAALAAEEGGDVKVDLVEIDSRRHGGHRGGGWLAAGIVEDLSISRGSHRTSGAGAHSGGEQGDLDLAFGVISQNVAHDDVGIFRVGELEDVLHGLVGFSDAEIRTGGDVDQKSLCAFDASFQQRGRRGSLGSHLSALLTDASAKAHEGDARVAHDAADVGEVDVDDAGEEDDVRDPLDTLSQHVIRGGESLLHCRALIDHAEKAVVWNGDEGVDLALELGSAFFGKSSSSWALEDERLGDNANGKDAEFAGHFGDHGGRAGAGSTAHTGGDKDHVAAIENGFDVALALKRGSLADLRIATGTEATGELIAQLKLNVGAALAQGLRVGVHGDELHAFNAFGNHAVDGIRTGATHADYFNRCLTLK